MGDPLTVIQSALGERYRIERELGRGGMATVYLAEDLKHHRQVAVKVFRPELSAAIAEKRFLQEIDITAHLSHPGILPLYDSGNTNGILYYVMPYLDTDSLRQRLSEAGQMPVGEALRIIRTVADALVHAHARGFVHRDIKPENILFQADHPVVSDFGIARALSQAGAGRITDTGLAVGTPAYISPEQASGSADVDHRADLYSLGVVAYELLSGSPPFVRITAQQTIAAHVAEIPRAVGELRASVPSQVTALVMRCLEKDPAQRPQSALEVMQVLETVTGLELASAGRTDAKFAARSALVRALGIYVLAFVAVGASAWTAMIALGLPDWVFPGALIVMTAGLPAIFLTAWVHYSTRNAPAISGAAKIPASDARPGFASRLLPYLTWRKTGWGTVAALVLFVLGVSGFMSMRVAGIGPAATLLSAGRLDPNKRLLLADFDVRGADSSLGPVLTSAARVALEQSTTVRLISSTAVLDALERMQRPRSTRIDLELAREIAIRDGIQGIVHGELVSLGGRFLLTLRLLEPESGTALASFNKTTSTSSALLSGVDDLSRQLRSRIGESLRLTRATPPLERVTTSKLDALRSYTAGIHANYVEQDYTRAVQLLQDAVTIDSGFAMAWRALAAAGSNARMGETFITNAVTAAFRHRERATQNERDLINGMYYGYYGDRARSATAYEALVRRDSDHVAMLPLAAIYASRREFARAESMIRMIIVRDSMHAVAHHNLVVNLLRQGKHAAAESVLAAAERRFPLSHSPAMLRAHLLYARGDLEEYDRVLRTSHTSTNPSLRSASYRARWKLLLTRGRISDYFALREEARALGALRPEDTGLVESFLAATVESAIRLDPTAAVARIEEGLRLPSGGVRDPFDTLTLALSYAWADRPDRARAVLAPTFGVSADSALLRHAHVSLHNTLGEIARAEKRYEDAVALFRRADARSDGPSYDCAFCLSLRLGRVFDEAGRVDSAIANYERFLTTPGYRSDPRYIWDMFFLARTYERLGYLYEFRENRDRAIHYYGTFVDLWKDADPDLQPRVAEARRRMTLLQRRGR